MAADRHLVALVEPLPARKSAAVDDCAVATAQILDRSLTRGDHDGGVLPADSGRVDHQIAVGVAADERAFPVEREPLAAAGAGLEFEERHSGGCGRWVPPGAARHECGIADVRPGG